MKPTILITINKYEDCGEVAQILRKLANKFDTWSVVNETSKPLVNSNNERIGWLESTFMEGLNEPAQDEKPKTYKPNPHLP